MQEDLSELKEKVAVVQNDVKWIRDTLEQHVTKSNLDSVKNELFLHRWIIGAFFGFLVTIGAIIVGAN